MPWRLSCSSSSMQQPAALSDARRPPTARTPNEEAVCGVLDFSPFRDPGGGCFPSVTDVESQAVFECVMIINVLCDSAAAGQDFVAWVTRGGFGSFLPRGKRRRPKLQNGRVTKGRLGHAQNSMCACGAGGRRRGGASTQRPTTPISNRTETCTYM